MNDLKFDILEKLGATIMGVKPAEILNVKNNESLVICKNFINEHPELGYLRIRKMQKEGRIQYIFFHKTCIEKTLNRKEKLEFLRDLGYPDKFSVKAYLNFLKVRLCSEDFPHEIGLFLGYPFKDVLGFMGKTSLRLVTVKGWRYYGNATSSLKKYNTFKSAKENFKKYLYSLSLGEKLVDWRLKNDYSTVS